MAELDPQVIVGIIFYVLVFGQLIRIALVDGQTQKIANVSLVLLALTWVVWNAIGIAFAVNNGEVIDWKPITDGLIGALVVGGGAVLITIIFEGATDSYGMGGGDIKLLAVMGLYLGLSPSIGAVLIACIGLVVFALLGQRSKTEALPFGPWIVVGWIVMMLLGGLKG